MSTGTSAAPAKKASLFGKKEQKFLKDPLWDTNPITLQVLGICSALAVTSTLKPALVMCISVIVVLCGSNVIISLMRNMIPSKIRIIVMLAVVSTLVTLVDQVLKAYMYELSKELSVFVGLIITNCIVLGRAEAFALANKPWPSFLDGLGNGLGYSIILVLVAIGRELFGNGTLMGFQVIPSSLYDMGYVNSGLMILSPGAFILLGLIIWVQKAFSKTVEE
ncbi:MAG: NADH:ubiquinone reductase (Na(+)-transporting) subunit D [Acidobacteria bacterium]|nr:MAG: NADH:ubiquinone reductase (Na(+)-transporting) subunit D [Acidobacteriota bacterium]